MLWIIGGISLGIVFSIIDSLESRYNIKTALLNTLAIVVFSFSIAIALNVIIGGILTTVLPTHYAEPESTSLVAIHDDYFVALGTSKSNTPIYVYAVETDSGILLKTSELQEFYVQYDGGEPRVEYYVGEFANPVLDLFGYNFTDDYYVIYIPENGFMPDMTIDLKSVN